jgi:hypothetical protein
MFRLLYLFQLMNNFRKTGIRYSFRILNAGHGLTMLQLHFILGRGSRGLKLCSNLSRCTILKGSSSFQELMLGQRMVALPMERVCWALCGSIKREGMNGRD